MTFDEYIPYAVRTLNNLGSRKKNLAHMALGLSSEILEYQLAIENNNTPNIGEELSDLSWFTASTFHLLGLKYRRDDFVENHVITEAMMVQTIEKIVSQIKKHFAYGTPILNYYTWLGRKRIWWHLERNKKFIHLNDLDGDLHRLVLCLRHFSHHHGFDYELDILPANISKLAKRYPKGYSDFYASIRLDKNV